ncbi:WYL domain-containing protein [Staphylococcus aureus]
MKKSERLNQELIFLSHKHSFHLKDLMAEFDISKRTALRDIQELEAMGLTIYVENGRYGGYKIISQNLLTPIYFNSNEILAIFFALKSLDLLSSTPFEKSYKQIREKLFATIPVQQQQNISKTLNFIHYHNISPINNSENLATILQSIMNENTVTITYTQFDYIETEIQIYELFYRNGVWFCSAYDVRKELWGTYRCDYITQITINESRTNTYTREALADFQNNYEATYHDIPFKCKLSSFGVELFLKNNYPNMELTYIEGTPYITGGYNIEELDYMVHYLISLGENVEILYPEQLKHSYLNKMRSIIEKYK